MQTGGEFNIHHHDNPKVHHRHVKLVGPLRSVAKRQDEARQESHEVQPLDHDAQNPAGPAQQVVFAEELGQNVKDEEEVALKRYFIVSIVDGRERRGPPPPPFQPPEDLPKQTRRTAC